MSGVDAVVVGAGPAGAASAILLTASGWRVMLVEQHSYPRQKVCGECLTPAGLALLDDLGVGARVLECAGPELTQVGWMSQRPTLIAALPPCLDGPHRYGRALGRDTLDALLLARAAALGVEVVQPAKVRRVDAIAGGFRSEITASRGGGGRGAGSTRIIESAHVIDAHGSWEPAPAGSAGARYTQQRNDLFAFKASFCDAQMAPGLLPVLSFDGGYGGIVVAENGRLTLAGCIRRDTLHAWRLQRPGISAGLAMETYLRASCRGIRDALQGAKRLDSWLSVGPLRLGLRATPQEGPFLVGNAAGEMHPLIGEGMSMALQSAFLLTDLLRRHGPSATDSQQTRQLRRTYNEAWRRLLCRFPQVLTAAARWAGKSRVPRVPRVAVPLLIQSGTL
jgi:2-polyprenyl-6-methoxyphenol hydroxylase-like FAD-dependent oxidoreductase